MRGSGSARLMVPASGLAGAGLGIGLVAAGAIGSFGAYVALTYGVLVAIAVRPPGDQPSSATSCALASAGLVFAAYLTLLGLFSYLLAAIPVLLLWMATNIVVLRQGVDSRSWFLGAGVGAMVGALPGVVLLVS